MIRSWFKDMFGESTIEVGGADTTLKDRAALAAWPIMLQRVIETASSPTEWHGKAAANAWAAADAFVKIRPKA